MIVQCNTVLTSAKTEVPGTLRVQSGASKAAWGIRWEGDPGRLLGKKKMIPKLCFEEQVGFRR